MTRDPARHRSGAVTGVELGGGERLAADVVVCNADLPVAYRTLLGGVDAPRAARRGRYSPSCLLWVAGVRGGPPAGAAHHNIHFGRQWDESFDALIDDGRADGRPVDPRHAALARRRRRWPRPAARRCTRWSRCPTSTAASTGRGSATLPSTACAARSPPPGYPTDVVTEEVYDPLDWEAMGMERGTPFALAHTFRQTGPFRPRNVDRRVPGLVFVGSSTVPGVGVPMVLVSGKLAAARVRRDGAA